MVQGLIQSELEISKARDCTASLGDLIQHLPEPMGTRVPYVLAEPLICHYPLLPFVLPPGTMVRNLALYSPGPPCRYRQPVSKQPSLPKISAPHQPSLLRAGQAQLPQPFPTGTMLQSLPVLSAP